ncbi:hypothetical protein [Methylobacterium aquaticum]|uniref:hypothetical protein n=1 Tax=Methylobacterium aquaticum TaxID=270351 RepID=UPI00193137D3|nr:hypothetical protein [Methylobacterium aquaticum]QRE76511.1 hypothetical protein F1D61_25680 [Methylobacterium aquaticum]
MTSERIKAVGESTPPLSIGFDIAIAMCRRADVLGHPYPSPELRVWLANQITLAVNAARSSSPTLDGVIKERGEDKEVERALRDGLSPVEPASGLNPSDFDPSRAESGLAAFAKEVIAAGWNAHIDEEFVHSASLRHGLVSETTYDPKIHGDNDIAAEVGDPWFVFAGALSAPGIETGTATTEGRGPKDESPIREAEAPASTVQPPSSQESGVGETEWWRILHDGDNPRPDVEWSGYLPDEAASGPAIAYADDTGEPLFVVWWADLGNGRSQITHWRDLPTEILSAPRPSQREG